MVVPYSPMESLGILANLYGVLMESDPIGTSRLRVACKVGAVWRSSAVLLCNTACLSHLMIKQPTGHVTFGRSRIMDELPGLDGF